MDNIRNGILFYSDELGERAHTDVNVSYSKVSGTIDEVRTIISAELENIATGNKERSVAPTVTALRSHAKDVLASETQRLEKKLGDSVDEKAFAEIRKSLHRVAEKLIHTPTVKVKELAVTESEVDYAQALMQLFDLPVNKTAHAKTSPETKVATRRPSRMARTCCSTNSRAMACTPSVARVSWAVATSSSSRRCPTTESPS